MARRTGDAARLMSLAARAARCGVLVASVALTRSAAAQHDMHDMAMPPRAITLGGGASAIVVGTQVDPGIDGRRLREGYLTQPMLHGHVLAFGGALGAQGMLDFEGATLRRGELAPGAWGEGYADRRHPHSWLHELVGFAASPEWRGAAVSVAGGKGFAPFGTDDPMVRPIERFPVNHHLSQILERAIIVGAFRWRLLTVEGARFNGDEPESPADAPDAAHFANSWARRLTLRPVAWLELQASDAHVRSPESPTGHGSDHEQGSASLRAERPTRAGTVYALAEWSTLRMVKAGTEGGHLGSALFEGSLDRGSFRVAARYERSLRPEEERLADSFRTPYPTAEVQILGVTRFDIATASLSRTWSVAGLRLAPFVEGSLIRARPTTVPAAFDPARFYGRDRITVLSIGMRIAAGMPHHRVGRYGVAAASSM
ncbi:MAG: hypothetical protein ACJ79K_08505 [Gemmatimonadaceae bacterium]